MKDFLLNVWRGANYFWADIVFRVLYRSRAIGRENIPGKGGVLLASNHISGMETLLIPYLALSRFSQRQLWSPAKEELFAFPLLRWILNSWRAFPVKRNARDFSSMNRIAELAKDHVVMIYPEGTRSKDGKLGKGRPGVGKIIYDSRTTVIPTLVVNTNHCLPSGKWFPRFFIPLYVIFGKPLDLAPYFSLPQGRDTSTAIADALMEAIAELKKKYGHLDIGNDKK